MAVIDADVTRSDIIGHLEKAADLMESGSEPEMAWFIRGVTDAFDGRSSTEARAPDPYRHVYLLGYETAKVQMVATVMER